MSERQQTHSENCWKWHFNCAVAWIERQLERNNHPILTELEAERDEARAVLKRYGWHRLACAFQTPPYDCDCGWSEARAKLEGE